MEKFTKMIDALVQPEDDVTIETVLANALQVIPYPSLELHENNYRLVSDKAFKGVLAQALKLSLNKTLADLEKKLKQVYVHQEIFNLKIQAEHLNPSPNEKSAIAAKLDGKISELTQLLDKCRRLDDIISDTYAKYMVE